MDILGTVSSFIGGNKLLLVIGVVLAISLGANYAAYKVIESKNQEIGELNTATKIQQNTIDTMIAQKAQDQALVLQLSRENGKLDTETNLAKNQLNSYRNRLDDITIKKPGLVQGLANKKWQAGQDKLREMTKND